MLAPYPDRLKSSRSSPAQANSTSTPTPSPPPPNAAPPPPSASHHRLFSSRSNLPLTRMRTNSLSSPTPSRADSPSSDFVVPTSLRNATRKPPRPARPSTSSGIPDQKSPPVPIVVTSPGASSVTVSLLSVCDVSSLVDCFQFKAICRLYAHS